MGRVMAKVRVMYWKEIPVQIQAEDDAGTVTVQLNARFQEAVDAVAMFDGSIGSDAYLDGWGYGDYEEQPGGAKERADALAAQYNENMPDDFVARIRDLDRAGSRAAEAGAIDQWAGL